MTAKEPEERSGLNKPWVDSLEDMFPYCAAYLLELSTMPVRSCDFLCGNPAEFWADVHGCDSVCACKGCLDAWVFEANGHISSRGGIWCGICRLVYSILPSFMRWRVI